MANAWDPNATAYTLKDFASVQVNDKIGYFANLLARTNSILADMPMVECNSGSMHEGVLLTKMGTVSTKRFNAGVAVSKNEYTKIQETTAMYEARTKLDAYMYKTMKNGKDFRLMQSEVFVEAFQQTLNRDLLYANSTDDSGAKFDGLAARYSSLTSDVGQRNILDAGGTGADNTSIWLVCWGPKTIHGIYRQGTTLGLSHEDLGQSTVTDADGKEYEVVRDKWNQHLGLFVQDWRYVVRIANIDVSDLMSLSGTQNPTNTNPYSIANLMRDAIDTIPMMGMGTPVFYANRKVISKLRSMLQIQKSPDFNNYTQSLQQATPLKIGAIADNRNYFDGDIPIRTVDEILNTEARVV